MQRDDICKCADNQQCPSVIFERRHTYINYAKADDLCTNKWHFAKWSLFVPLGNYQLCKLNNIQNFGISEYKNAIPKIKYLKPRRNVLKDAVISSAAACTATLQAMRPFKLVSRFFSRLRLFRFILCDEVQFTLRLRRCKVLLEFFFNF